ncbi:hypothetical protein FSARC_5277 [Fusarium sarcochroum]|uniref:Uncharacterized protein n=1 Tax=Fusarium sarcochroum TaxID=1208366 RepID=A0A8H4TZP8_9HYPO|nr:hypothetical protein FSARC_5277 [Fusarium sarcochroum]
MIDEEPMPLHEDTIPYYRGCLLKLAAFRMHEINQSIDRVLVLDADQLIIHNLDHLFALPPHDFVAPNAYWIDPACLSSTLMLIRPNRKQWRLVQQALLNPLPRQYDMDIINDLFEGTQQLPGSYVTVNSHWEDWNIPPWFNFSTSDTRLSSSPVAASEKDLHDLYNQAEVLHFFAVGKPWMYSVQELKAMKPASHKLLFEQWGTWRRLASQVCPVGTIDHA